MTELIVVRHGATDSNIQKKIIGWNNPSISENSRDEVKMIAAKVKHHKLDAIYCSSLIRAVQTAKIIHSVLNTRIPLRISTQLREVDYGRLSGMKKSDADVKYPRFHNDITFKHPGGESFEQMHNRIVSYINEISARYDKMLIVTHSGCIRSLYSLFNGQTLQDNINMKISHSVILQCRQKDENLSVDILQN